MSEEQPKVQDNQHVDLNKELLKEKRQNLVTLGFLQAMWKILKEYKQKLQESNNEVEHLKVSINKEKSRNAAVKKELIDVKSCLMNHGRTLEEVCSDLKLVEENIYRTMFSHAELENDCEDVHSLSSNAEEQEIPSHSEAGEGSVNEG